MFQIIHDEFFTDIDAKSWKEKIDNTLISVGLNPEHILGKYPHQLSGGQLQRFLIARALLLDIQFLVADEIISMLDASTRIDVLNLLGELKKSRELSILFITHDLSLANYISEHAAILYRGFVVERGYTGIIFNKPLHPYTQMLVASVPRLDRKWKESATLNEKSTPTGYISGCPYQERCPYAFERCKEQPELVEVELNHFVACWKITS
jgi:peptide/nickel transport system ATP-binding protein